MAGELRALYGWLDAVPLSRPRRNIARDFSDGVLAAEVVKFFFPSMVQLHSYVPASSTPQKLANWGHLNRKVLRKLNFSVPAEVMRQVVQCRPGAVEQVLLLLRQKIEEKQKQNKALPGPGQVSRAWGGRGAPAVGQLLSRCCFSWSRGKKSCPGCAQAAPGDGTGHLQLAEREQALLLAQETIQILQLKVGRLEQLLHLKNVRIDDLSRRLREAQSPQR
uniref:Sperm flagellar 1 n=1 Tax=Strix occidentalis caurina TaxID=311401 RepID=A0A8D0G1J7_STROC